MKNRQALLVGDLGDHFLITLETASLLKRAGFCVDIITNNPVSKKLTSINDRIFVHVPEEIPRISLERLEKTPYDLIVILDDFTLKIILDSDLSEDEKLRLLPVTAREHVPHLCSKIGLSTVFRRHGIRTPDFLTASNKGELRNGIEELGCPVFVKIDFSSGGRGVFECETTDDIEDIGEKIDTWPVILQKKIIGKDTDLSALYQNSELIFFSQSNSVGHEFDKYSPSSVRVYTQLGKLESAIFDELRNLGRAIGANGFVNVTCIESQLDRQRFYVEADMRPNAWVNFPRFFGDDPALRVSRYFSGGEVMAYPQPVHSEFSDQVVLPYFARISLWQLLANKHKSWSRLPDESAFVVMFVLFDKEVKNITRRVLKPLVPTGLWLRLKRTYDAALRKFMR